MHSPILPYQQVYETGGRGIHRHFTDEETETQRGRSRTEDTVRKWRNPGFKARSVWLQNPSALIIVDTKGCEEERRKLVSHLLLITALLLLSALLRR